MEGRNLFISSCSRRELSRRKPSRTAWRVQLTFAMLLLFVAALAFVITRLGLS
jgi:hypothetical protein